MSIRRRTMHLVVTGAAAVAFSVAPTALLSGTTAVSQAQPCVNGVVPGNPYVGNCNLPRKPRIRGAAPDAAAIIACRDWPGCLSWYVNGP